MDSSASLQRWQQAFEDHPISTTRIIEKQLRSGVASNRERLRAVVGGNYRELLSTADQIVSLDAKTRVAEVRISELGQLCGPPPPTATRRDVTRSRMVAETRLLQRCVDATRLSVSEPDLLRAAQLLVIARLLSKSLNDHRDPPASLPALQQRVTALRRHAIIRIDGILASPRSSSASMVNAACAYCLITSASSIDAFKYAQRLRLDKLRRILDLEQPPTSPAVGMLRYILSTSQMLKRVFARALTDALSNIQRRPILSDLNLVNTGVIGSSELLTLVSEDIRSFTPYFKRELVSTSDLAASLDQWTSGACEVLHTALEQQLQQMQDISEVLELRRQLYSSLLPLYFSSAPSQKIHLSIQQSLSKRIEALVKSRADQVKTIGADFVRCEPVQQKTLDLWNSGVASMTVNGGGTTFLSHVKKRRHGTNGQMVTISRSLVKWTMSARQMLTAFEDIKSIRWRDLLEEPDDDQDPGTEGILKALVNEAPAEYSAKAGSSLKAAVAAFESNVLQAAVKCVEDANDHDVGKGVYYLRVIRLTLQSLRKALPAQMVLNDLEGAIPKLHQLIATKTVAQVLSSLDKDSLEQVQATPAVENLPSPVAFTLLRETCAAMSAVGGHDIWSEVAVIKLKSILTERVLANEASFIRSGFDVAYLGCALASTRTDMSPQPTPEEAKAAAEYWSRTKLLFGSLAR